MTQCPYLGQFWPDKGDELDESAGEELIVDSG
jgi:hypothetical protein